MRSFFHIFKFEFMNYIKNKLFIGMTIFLIAVIGIVLSFPHISAMFSSKDDNESSGPRVAVSRVDEGSLEIFRTVLPDNEFVQDNRSEEELKKAVSEGEYESAIIITGDMSYRYIVKNLGLYDTVSEMVREILTIMHQNKILAGLGASASDIIEFREGEVSGEVIQVDGGKNQAENFLYTYILIFALYMAIILYGQLVASSVATEKSSRAMELLITSSKPLNLMFGKIIGTGCAGLLQFVLIFGSAFVFYNINADVYKDNILIKSIFNMPIEMLLYALMFFVLGFFIYSFMYGALASLVSRIEQLNTTILPVTYMFIAAFMIVMFSMSAGKIDSTLMKVASFVPFTSPIAMFTRITMGNVAVWEIIVSTAVLFISTAAIGYLAALIYRMGVMMYGQPPKLKEIFKALKSSRNS